ncbi:MAG TPA: hypothetical protein VFJ16_24195 [Longimicrobium sp.]|nr:hypothetical protein [Longimicrobium sp.]
MKRIRTVALVCWTASGCAAQAALPGRPQPSTVVTQTRSIQSVPLKNNGANQPGPLLRGPLYVVDGRRFTADELTRRGLNPGKIVEMEVLWGPAASALYGASAAEGLVIITTRAGARP